MTGADPEQEGYIYFSISIMQPVSNLKRRIVREKHNNLDLTTNVFYK